MRSLPLLAALCLLPLGCGEVISDEERDVPLPIEEERRLDEDHAAWTQPPDHFEVTLWYPDGCQRQAHALELVTPTLVTLSTSMVPGQVACTLVFSSTTFAFEAPSGMSRTEPVEFHVDSRDPIVLQPPAP